MPINLTRVLGALCSFFNTCTFLYPNPEISPIPSFDIRRIENEFSFSTNIFIPNLGRIEGYHMNSVRGKLITAFEGIPYAEPPIGNLRFREPIKKGSWGGTFLAKRKTEYCIQMNPLQFYNAEGKEDCLFMNIYVPSSNIENERKPVMLFIHGGSFFWGSGSDFGPAFLLDYDKNTILVNFQYRLGPFGFLSTGDSNVPGNAGLKDQAMAINWVKDNIHYFGGDPDKITLFGHSAGAVSTHLQMMGPSKNKIERAISQSGNGFAHWAFRNGVADLSKKLSRFVHCPTNNNAQMVNCLKNVPARDIISAQYKLFESGYGENPAILFSPVLEHPHSTAFITQSPEELYKMGKVAKIPWITGITKDEGDLQALVSYAAPLMIRRILRNWNDFIPKMLIYNQNDTQMSQDLKDFYLGNFKSFSFSGFETMNHLSQMFGDRFFNIPFAKSLDIHTNSPNTGPLYAYFFSHQGKHGVAEKLNMTHTDWGVMHMDELQYLFNSTNLFMPFNINDPDFQISDYMTQLWTQFASSGFPQMKRSSTPSDSDQVIFDDWTPYTRQNKKLLDISFNSGMISFPYRRRVNFWQKTKYY